MCRLFAVRADRPVKIDRAFSALRQQALEHKDGWGIARFDDGEPHVEVNVTPAHACARFATLGDTLETRSLLTHIRLASVGSVTEVNAHPFVADGFAFMHNGTVAQFKHHRQAIAQHVAPRHLARVRGETDSELCFALFRTELERSTGRAIDDLFRALAKVMTTVGAITDVHEHASAMNFMVSDGVRVAATRRGRTLFSHAETGCCVIASERLWNGEWVEVPENGLIGLDETLSFRHARVHDWA